MIVEEIKNEMWIMFEKIKNNASRIIEKSLKNENLNSKEAMVLFFISNHKNVGVCDISNEIVLNQGNTSSMLKKLERNGYITRVRSSDDERKVILEITLKGDDIIKRIDKLLNDNVKDLYLKHKEKFENMYVVLRDLNSVLEEEMKGEANA